MSQGPTPKKLSQKEPTEAELRALFPEFYLTPAQQERNRVLMTKDPVQIKDWMRRVGIPVPEDEGTFRASIHMAIVGCEGLEEDQKAPSRAWLVAHNYHKVAQDFRSTVANAGVDLSRLATHK